MFKEKHYCISAKNVLAHELIGLKARIVESTDAGKKGLSGKIVDETKNLLMLETKNGLKKIPKKEVVLEIDLDDEKVEVDGKLLVEKPENRVKLFWRRYHGKLQ